MGHHQNESGHHYILICSNCNKPTYFPYNEDVQYPGTSYRDRVQHIDDEGIAALYEEARDCISVGACTAAVLCCRKILTHAAVLQKAPKNKKLIDYVQYLADNHFLPPNAKGWVDHIRKKSNCANYGILLMTLEEAKQLIDFTGMLLKLIYEYPNRIVPPQSPRLSARVSSTTS